MALCSRQPAWAQLNESDTTLFQLRTSLTGSYQKGNVDLLAIRAKIEFTLSPNRNWVFKSQHSGLYQAFYDTKADNDIFSRNYLYYQPYKPVYLLGIVYISTNYRRKIDRRCFAGLGGTVQLWNSRTNVVKASVSAVYEQTRFAASEFNRIAYNGSWQVQLWRGTTWLGGSHYLLDNHLRLYYDAFWQPAFRDVDNYRWQVDIGLDFPIWKGLTFNALYTYTHENLVVSRVRQDDRLLTFGLAYNLRKYHN